MTASDTLAASGFSEQGQNSSVQTDADIKESDGVGSDSVVGDRMDGDAGKMAGYPSGPVSAYVAELLSPIGDENPVGSDPFYGDRFYVIKREIDKLSGTQWQTVIRESHALLSNEAKDLRVAAYHLMAAVYINGVQGFIDGLAVYSGILKSYGQRCFPTRDSARLTAVRWLGNRRMQLYCEGRLAAASADQLDWIRAAIDQINELLVENFGDDIDRWTHLDNLISQLRAKSRDSSSRKASGVESRSHDAEEGGDAHANGQTGHDNAVTAASENVASTGRPTSEQQFIRYARGLVQYLAESGDLCRAAAMTRAVLWGNLQLPPAEGVSTSISGPRNSDLVEIKQLLKNQDFNSALTLSESLMFGPGGRLSLDLQYYSMQAAQGLNKNDLVHIIENATSGLLRRLPKLTGLRFVDGADFARAETRRWLEGLTNGTNEADGSQAVDDDFVMQVIKRAHEIMSSSGLPSALAVFARETNSHPLTLFRLQMEMAYFCLTQQRADLAVPVFKKLMDKARRECLANWNPELFARLAKLYREALRAMWEQSSEERKSEYEQCMEELCAVMCQADLVQASKFL